MASNDHLQIVTTLSKLKRKVAINRGVDVTEKMETNSAKLLKYTSCLSDSTKQWGDKSLPEEDKLTFRSQKVLCNFSNTDAGNDCKDDGPSVAAPIIFGNSSGGKTAVRPVKLAPQPNVPPYTTWIYLDRNQRMTEDQSVQGRRRIYYDPVGNETLIASDSEEEEAEDEDPKHDFSKGEDFIIWTAVQERGASAFVFDHVAQCIHVNRDEVQARYELLLKDVDKQAKCEAHGEGIRSKVPSPSGRRKGTRDLGRLTFRETQTCPIAESYVKVLGNGLTRKLDEEKGEAKDLVAAMDSFDNLFCRRCLVFDCRLHGCSQPLVHPSERQPSANTDSETAVPCGPHCHLLSQHARGETSNSCVPRILDSKAGDLPSAEGADRARVAKRQKTQGCETWVGENQESANTAVDGTSKLFASAAQMSSTFDKVVKLSVNKEDNNTTPRGTAETPLVIGYKDASQSLKGGQPAVASRLTSHKKLARTSRRAIEENGSIGDSHQRQTQVTVIDLTGEMKGEAVEGIAKLEQLQLKHVSKELCHGEVVVFHQEKTRFSSTKKLARRTKRALEENLLSPVEVKPNQAQGDPIDSGHGEVGGKGQDVTRVNLVNKVARTIENEIQEKVVGAVSTRPLIAGVTMDICQKGVDLLKEKFKGTSPKKLARSARKPVEGKLVGMVEVQEPQTPRNVLASSKEEEKPVKEEKTRNTAARKLARSARKVFAEKVAVAIQHQQLQSQVDLVHKSRGAKEHAKEERFDTGSTHEQVLVTTGTVHVTGGDKLQKPNKIHLVDSSQLVDKDSQMLGDCEEVNNDVEVKPNRPSAGPTKGGGLVVFRCEDISKRVAFKDNWTALEKGLYEKGLQIFGKNSCMIANNMLKGCKTCTEVREYIVAQEAAASHGAEAGLHQFPDSLACVLKWDVARARARFYGRRKGSRKLKFTLKSAGQSAIRKRMANGKDAPCRQYTPCGCLFTCGKQCPCQLSGTCCEKYCGCAKSCKNRFRGCHCAKSQCCSRQCPCFAAGRECDPDVCRNCWIGCGDDKLVGPPQREDKDNYQCHNMKLLLKQQQRVLLSRSDVAGWGAFLKSPVSKHEYLGEYTGELISHREADKRGKIYDRENSSFLFNLNDQYVLDACRKGDKLKFANHSPNPNCYAKVIMVAGDHRVGIFAKERIAAGEELFYDYRYEADRAPAWARRGEYSGNGKKDDTLPGERRLKQAS